MSQASLKDDKIKGLKASNDKINLENEALKEEVSMLKLKLVGKFQLQGAKHFLWDTIIVEISNFLDYFFLIEDKKELTHSTLTKFQVAKEDNQMYGQ